MAIWQRSRGRVSNGENGTHLILRFMFSLFFIFPSTIKWPFEDVLHLRVIKYLGPCSAQGLDGAPFFVTEAGLIIFPLRLRVIRERNHPTAIGDRVHHRASSALIQTQSENWASDQTATTTWPPVTSRVSHYSKRAAEKPRPSSDGRFLQPARPLCRLSANQHGLDEVREDLRFLGQRPGSLRLPYKERRGGVSAFRQSTSLPISVRQSAQIQSISSSRTGVLSCLNHVNH